MVYIGYMGYIVYMRSCKVLEKAADRVGECRVPVGFRLFLSLGCRLRMEIRIRRLERLQLKGRPFEFGVPRKDSGFGEIPSDGEERNGERLMKLMSSKDCAKGAGRSRQSWNWAVYAEFSDSRQHCSARCKCVQIAQLVEG